MSSVEASLLPWQWIIESLANNPDAKTSIFSDIVKVFPSVVGDSSNAVRERLALRYLEDCAGMFCGETLPAVVGNSNSTLKLNASQTCEEVLRSKVGIANDHEKEDATLCGTDLQQFIFLKKAALKKTSIELLKEKFLPSYQPGFLYSKDCNDLLEVRRLYRLTDNCYRDDHGIKKIIQTIKHANLGRQNLTLIRKYRELKNLNDTPSKSVDQVSKRASDDKQNWQTNNDGTLINFCTEEAKSNIGEAASEFHNVELHPSKGNLSGFAFTQDITPDSVNESHSEQDSQNHDFLGHDRAELHELGGSDSDDVELLQQYCMPQPSSVERFCIKCGSNGQLLNCCTGGCSRAIHEKCLGLLASLEETGTFCCPFCSYRNACMLFEKSKREAQEARRNLFLFYDLDPAVHAIKKKKSEKSLMESEQVCDKHNTSKHGDFHSNQLQKHGDIQNAETNQRITQNDPDQLNITDDISCKSVLPCNVTVESCYYQKVLNTPVKLNDETGTEHGSTRVIDEFGSLSIDLNQSLEHKDDDFVKNGTLEVIRDCIQLENTRKLHTSDMDKEEEIPLQPSKISVLNVEGGCDHSGKQGVAKVGFDSLSSMANNSHEQNDICTNHGTCKVSKNHMQVEEMRSLLTSDAETEEIPLQQNKSTVLNLEGGCNYTAKRKVLSSIISVRFAERKRRKKAAREDNYHESIVENKTYGYTSRRLRKRNYHQSQRSSIERYSVRRLKVVWSPEEEEILKEAMQKLSHNEDGRFPWIKILEYGRGVLHKSRTPIDLKDKWRNMQKKDALTAGFYSIFYTENAPHGKNDICANKGSCKVSKDHMQVEEARNICTSDADTEEMPLQPNLNSGVNLVGGNDHSAKRKALSSNISVRFAKRDRGEKALREDNCHGSILENKKRYAYTWRELRKRRNHQNQRSSIERKSIRRLNVVWRPEEEEILKEAMQKLSHNEDGSMPWIKILEYGCGIFHESRTPIDIKDKWRNMQKKEAKNRD